MINIPFNDLHSSLYEAPKEDRKSFSSTAEALDYILEESCMLQIFPESPGVGTTRFIILINVLPKDVVHSTLYCYSCTSAMTGCGDPIDVRTIHWKECKGRRVLKNYCVKVVERIGGIFVLSSYTLNMFLFAEQNIVTRGCLSDLLLNTQYRLDMPMLRRHGYCVNSRAYQRFAAEFLSGQNLTDFVMGRYQDNLQDFKRYCFCDDFMGCNSAQKSSSTLFFYLLGFAATIMVVFFT
ncbi:Inactive hydroxysteroid dehydrogenase-like protein 1 [Cichlidogyrus casuarinus]|uniref:Inactive hydroxysteroid dehydrogenase-like protein 1 n=1 Tax=Cichlidogyrus casuarinus TaxID=1844966 RepID=A0ABD2QAB0_9PLAT